MPSAARNACCRPSTAAVRSTSAVSMPGVRVSSVAARVKAIRFSAKGIGRRSVHRAEREYKHRIVQTVGCAARTASHRETTRCARRTPGLAAIRLEQPGSAHAATDAHGDDAVAQLAALQLAYQMADLARAGHAEGMADGDGATV